MNKLALNTTLLALLIACMSWAQPASASDGALEGHAIEVLMNADGNGGVLISKPMLGGEVRTLTFDESLEVFDHQQKKVPLATLAQWLHFTGDVLLRGEKPVAVYRFR